MKQIHILKGVQINNPNNYQETSIELNYDNDSVKEAVSINTWEFGVSDAGDPTDANIICKQHISSGLLPGGIGVIEGLPYQIQIDDELGRVYDIFNGYVDLWKAKVQCGLIIAPAIEKAKLDWLTGVYDKYTYATLFDMGIILPTDFVPVPYIINKKHNSYEKMIAIMTIAFISAQITTQVLAITELAIEGANPLEATAIARLVLQIIYVLTAIVALVKLWIDLINMLIQPVKYHYGMYEYVLLEKGLSVFGLTLSSSILQQFPYNDCLILPEKYNVKDNNTGSLKGVAGFFNANANEHLGYFKGTVGELLRRLQLKYHAKILIDDNNVLYFEKQDFNLPVPLYTLPDLERSEQSYEFNWQDFEATFILSFETDLEDRNTIQEYTGTSVQVITEQQSYTDKKLSLARNLVQEQILFALGKRKTELTFVEETLSLFYKVVGGLVDGLATVVNAAIDILNAVIKVINKIIKALGVVGIKVKFSIPSFPSFNPVSFSNPIEDRIGMLKMESDFVSIPKNLMIKNYSNARNNKLLPYNEAILNARFLYENYHYFRSFCGRNGYIGNQWLIYHLEEIPFVFDDYEKVRRNNSIINYDGANGRLLSLKFNIDQQTSTGRYKINKVYLNNLIEKIIEPDGR